MIMIILDIVVGIWVICKIIEIIEGIKQMKEIIEKVLRVILWIIGFPIIVIVLGIFTWITCLIDFIDD